MALLPSERDLSRHDSKEREFFNKKKTSQDESLSSPFMCRPVLYRELFLVARSLMEHQQRVAVCWLVNRELVNLFHSLSCLPHDYSPTAERAVRLERAKDVENAIVSLRSSIKCFVSAESWCVSRQRWKSSLSHNSWADMVHMHMRLKAFGTFMATRLYFCFHYLPFECRSDQAKQLHLLSDKIK